MDQIDRRALLDALVSGKQCEVESSLSCALKCRTKVRWNSNRLCVEFFDCNGEWRGMEHWAAGPWEAWNQIWAPRHWDVEIRQGAPILPHVLMEFVRAGGVLRGRLEEVAY